MKHFTKHYAKLGLLLFLIPLYGHAEDSATTTASSTKEVIEETSTSTPVKTFTVCSQEAIETRDTKIAQGRTIYNGAMAKALLDRKNSEKAAVAIKVEGDKRAAIKGSVENYKTQSKAAQSILTQSRKATWQAFESDISKCRELENPDGNTSKADTTDDMVKTVKKEEATEVKTFKDTIKAQFESLKSLFN